jgi:hypothetical protein
MLQAGEHIGGDEITTLMQNCSERSCLMLSYYLEMLDAYSCIDEIV